MDRTVTWGALAACAGLAGCLTDGGGAIDIVPTLGLLDSALPFGATNGVQVPMLSADLNGVSNIDAKITFNADQTITFVLPSGGPPVTVASATLINGPEDNFDLRTTSATYAVGDVDVDVHLGEDALGTDLFILARIMDGFAAVPSPLAAFVAIGDETATLPEGSAVAYTGGFVSDVFDATGAPVSQMSGDTSITANFDASTVGIIFTQTGEASNTTFTGTNIPMTGAQYTGPISGGAYSGVVFGAFYGPGAEATAGVFNAVDAGGAGAADDLEVIGGFTGFQ